MRATVAKRIRRQVYGRGHHPGPVVYFTHQDNPGQRVADQLRWAYQKAKEEYKTNA